MPSDWRIKMAWFIPLIVLLTLALIAYLREKRQVLMADPRDATLSLKQIQIGFDPAAPEAQNQAKALGIANFAVSLSHSKEYAIAIAIAIGETK